MTTPALFLSHGAPPLADDPIWPGELARWSAALPRPRAILMVSAHWEDAPIAVSSTTGAPLIHDFSGFPQRYYQVRYDAPPAPELARSVERLLGRPGASVVRAEGRGLDHGAYVPLVEMFPAADVPVLQLSLPTLDPDALLSVGRRLAPLREEGVLVVGSGFTTHNLRLALWGDTAGSAPAWSADFDAWAAEAMAAGDVGALLDVAAVAPDARVAHPRTEHWVPLYVALGAALGSDGSGFEAASVIDGFWYGLSKRSWQLA